MIVVDFRQSPRLCGIQNAFLTLIFLYFLWDTLQNKYNLDKSIKSIQLMPTIWAEIQYRINRSLSVSECVCVCVSGVNYPRTLSVCKSLKTLNCIVSAISLSSATKCSTHSKPDIPSKVFKPHRLTFKYLSFKLQPKCRNDLSELLCKSNAIKFGRNMCIWCKPNTSDETRIWMYVIVSRHSDWDAFRCWMARRRVPVYRRHPFQPRGCEMNKGRMLCTKQTQGAVESKIPPHFRKKMPYQNCIQCAKLLVYRRWNYGRRHVYTFNGLIGMQCAYVDKTKATATTQRSIW